MKSFRIDLWNPAEYNYKAAYGFMPNLRAYLHDEDSRERKCMIMVPGGGYCMLAPHEGELPAMEYYRMGLNVFVLTYTNDITMSVPLKKQPMEDLSRAVRLVRSRADEWHVAQDKLLVCGFSAGGHVCASLCTHFDDVTDPDPALNAFSNRPDGAILGYPVITSGKYTHIYSMQALLGKEPPAQELEYFSLEKQVKKNTPPCFLWQTQEDDLVPVENTYLFAMALREKGVPFAHYVYPHGGHGLSVASMEQFSGWHGGEYVCEQLGFALERVKADTAVNLTPQRRQELIAQFHLFDDPKAASADDAGDQKSAASPDDAKAPTPADSPDDAKPENVSGAAQVNPFADVHTWLELSRTWFERFL